MITQEQVQQLQVSFKRVFTLPMSKMTLREVQNAIGNNFPNQQDLTKAVLDSLLKGEATQDLLKENQKFKHLIEEYSPQVRFAREVFEFGEFINIFSCDFLQQGSQVFFVNRMRRVDGEEYHFLSAPDTNIRLAHMFINRLRDLKKGSGNVSFDAHLIEELKSIKADVDDLLKT